jgi:hypothetical protein
VVGKENTDKPSQNPIGSIDKADLKRFIAWAETNFDLPCLHDFLTAVPTAELVHISCLLPNYPQPCSYTNPTTPFQEPITLDYVQSDEAGASLPPPPLQP